MSDRTLFAKVTGPSWPIVGGQQFSHDSAGRPDRPIHILVGMSQAGRMTFIARAIDDRLALLWGKGFVIDNVPGADANIAGEWVVRAAPDGYDDAAISILIRASCTPPTLKSLIRSSDERSNTAFRKTRAHRRRRFL
jgi:tripartite-type tricarboxylate transporter receptor subunit TctC